MKKFTDITNKTSSIDFNKKKSKNLSTDIQSLDNQLESEVEGTKLDGEWEIVSVIDVSANPPTNEALVINAELGSQEVKRGDYIYITAQIKKPGQTQMYHHSQMGVLKCQVRDIYNTMYILNSLK
jgi:hypothetical protein